MPFQTTCHVHRQHGVDGLHHLVYEVVDNSVDEHMAGFGEAIEVTIHIDGSVTVIDNGRGIPTGMHSTQRNPLQKWRSPSRTPAAIRAGRLHGVRRLHGVGISVVNALSEWLELEIGRTARYSNSVTNAETPGAAGRHRQDQTPWAPRSASSPTARYSKRWNSASMSWRSGSGTRLSTRVGDHPQGRPQGERNRSSITGRHRLFVDHPNEAKTPSISRFTCNGTGGPHSGNCAAIQRRLR